MARNMELMKRVDISLTYNQDTVINAPKECYSFILIPLFYTFFVNF